jgi:hypothetical protein
MPEEKARSPFDFLRGKPMMVVTAVLVAEVALFYGVSTQEYIPTPPPLDRFATDIGPWRMIRQTKLDVATENLLKADDTLTRLYGGPGDVDLYVAFFKSQRAGVTPHSPKVCLPSNGWTEESSRIISVSVPGEARAPRDRQRVSGEVRADLGCVTLPAQRRSVDPRDRAHQRERAVGSRRGRTRHTVYTGNLSAAQAADVDGSDERAGSVRE